MKIKKKILIPVILALATAAAVGLNYSDKSYYPDKNLTPGAVATEWTMADICKNGTGRYRNVPTEEKKEIAKNYKVPFPTPNVEYDHWYPLGVHGSNDIKNIWPMPAPQYHQKDVVEAFLNRQVCSGQLTEQEARQIIDKWYDFYKSHFSQKVWSISADDINLD